MVVALSNVIQNVYADQSYGLSGVSTAQISLQTNGIPNTNQGLLNLVGAGDVTVNTNALGQTVIESTGTVIPGTGTGGYVVTAYSGVISAPNNDILTADGLGNAKDSGVLVSSLAPKANAALTGTTTIALANITSMNGVLNALDFPGSDIGTQVNAAIATLPASGGEVYIPAGTYTQTTTILLPRTVKLHGASGFSTQLNYTPTTGWAVIMADAVAAAAFCPQGALEDLSLVSSSMSNANGAIYIGGTDGATPVGKTASPSSAVNPSTNFGDNTNIHRVRIMETGASGAFGVGIQWGNNAWSTNIFECTVSFCAIGLYFPATISLANSGENISIIGGIVGNNTLGLSIGGYALSGVDFHLTNVSFDYNTSWAIQNGTSADTSLQVTLDGCHIEQVNFWIQNFGIMSLTNCILVNGSSATVFLIDNEYPAFSMVGCEILTSCPALFKSAGYPATLVGNFSNTSLNNSAQLIDVVGNILTKGYVIASSFIGTTVQGGSSLYLSTSGTFLGWNYTGGSGESDFFNNYLTGGTQPTFQFYGNYSGTPALLFSIDGSGNTNPAGYLTINAATPTGSITGIAFGGTTTSSASTTGAIALPAHPAGFLSINIGGTVYKLPYYAS
jgi:hypothetical protein